MKKFLIFFFLVFSSVRALAFTTPYANHLYPLLGESVLHPDLYAWMNEMKSDQTVTSLEPAIDQYTVEYRDLGVALDFSINFHLKGIRLFDSGKVFQQYRMPLPNGLKYEMEIEAVLAHDKAFIWDENNPYVVVGDYDSMQLIVYMRDNRIEMVNIVADDELVRAKSIAGMVSHKFRLIPDGVCLSGDCKEGTGTMDWGDGVIKYTGEWEFGFPNGNGVYLDSFNRAYQGEFMMGFFWGEGVYKEDGKYEYTGEYRMGTRTGYGTAIYVNGFRYKGEWLNDVFHGSGVYYQQKGFVYEGDFNLGVFEGKGKMTTPYGYYKGEFKNGKPHGKGEQYAGDVGSTLKGTWVNGKKEGEFEFISSTNKKAVLYFENDQQVNR